ncbi:YdiU family protein [Desulfobotulus sp. H1]|uniref:Protein nucleotidyltransferase YdiU n=1 Tax=Desulfobotulus pelophilus TaxID=2823377 RepID=A0ABT3NA14_9BACT|nr:YdiU family protein [Desulfobotulus pelophilus]MCW7754275.1 YdiU family protein [Desulfobotulus pelophilus]
MPVFSFDNSYARLPDDLYMLQKPLAVKAPRLILLNRGLMADLGLHPESLAEDEWAGIFCGNSLPEGSCPLAMAYAGHQFGHFVPQLGDGRAILLGEVKDDKGKRWDIQLKGSGKTPFSRNGDGRAPLGAVLREYMISEALHAMGIPTTRSLAAVLTGEPVHRESVLPGAVLTRVAASHIRVGTFAGLAARDKVTALQILTDYTLERHFPHLDKQVPPHMGLLREVLKAQARLVAAWMHVGFIHGVMNTDNCAISGETIDFGPCAFMDAYSPARVFSSIDHHGRYAYGRQPGMAHWNLVRFAESLLPLMNEADIKTANAILASFPDYFQDCWLSGMGKKLGFRTRQPEDMALAQDLLGMMHANSVDFTIGFRSLCDLAESPQDSVFPGLFRDREAVQQWVQRWQHRLNREGGKERAASMRSVNPLYIPRNHRVEAALKAAEKEGDFSLFHSLLTVVSNPFEKKEGWEEYALAPAPEEVVHRTFCGT